MADKDALVVLEAGHWVWKCPARPPSLNQSLSYSGTSLCPKTRSCVTLEPLLIMVLPRSIIVLVVCITTYLFFRFWGVSNSELPYHSVGRPWQRSEMGFMMDQLLQEYTKVVKQHPCLICLELKLNPHGRWVGGMWYLQSDMQHVHQHTLNTSIYMWNVMYGVINFLIVLESKSGMLSCL